MDELVAESLDSFDEDKDGNVTDYDARPSVATLNQFLDSCF